MTMPKRKTHLTTTEWAKTIVRGIRQNYSEPSDAGIKLEELSDLFDKVGRTATIASKSATHSIIVHLHDGENLTALADAIDRELHTA